MKTILVFFLFVVSICSAQSVTLLQFQCGGPGGIDANNQVWAPDVFWSGGARWGAVEQKTTGGMLLPALPYNTLRYSAPVGSSFTYTFVLPPTSTGQYLIKLKFVEPNKTSVGQRIFNVSANNIPIITRLDLFATVGLLVPYDKTFTVTAPDGRTTLTYSSAIPNGNAIVSAIQIFAVDSIPP